MKATMIAVVLLAATALAWLGAPAQATPGAAPERPESELTAGHWEQLYEESGFAMRSPGERTAVADAAGNLHAVYGGSGLYHAWRANGIWQHELVDGKLSDVAGASIALDSTGASRICYRSTGSSTLHYAWQDAAGWHSEFVGPASAGCSIAAGPGNSVAIAYGLDDDLMYAYRDSVGWHTEKAGPGASPGSYSLVLPVPENPQLSFTGTAGLQYAYRDASEWHVERVTDAPNGHSLAVTSAGTPYLAIATKDSVLFATREAGAGWRFETVSSSERLQHVSLVLDPGDAPHLAFDKGYPWESSYLSYAVRVGGEWVTSPAGPGAPSQFYSFNLTLAIAAGVPVLAEWLNPVSWDYEPYTYRTRLQATLMERNGNVTELVARGNVCQATIRRGH